MLGTPEVDLFACRLNNQLTRFVSWKLDPATWMLCLFPGVESLFTFVLPSFPLLNRCLQKLENNQTLALLIAPVWPTQVWWPRILSLLVINSLMLPQDKDLLTLPQSGTLHPLRNQMRLLACLLSGNTMKQEEYRSQLLDCSWHPDEEVLRNSTPVHQKMDSILSPKENQSSSTTCRSSLGFSFLNFLTKGLLRVLSNVLEMHCLLMCFGRWLCIWTEPTSFTSVERCFMIMQSRPPRPKYTEVTWLRFILLNH